MEEILSKISITEIELSSFTFKRFQLQEKKSKLTQVLDYKDFVFKVNRGGFRLLLKNYFVPRGPFRAEFEFKITFESSVEITKDMLTAEVLKKLITENSGVFTENSYILSFITDRAFNVPLILPPYPVED